MCSPKLQKKRHIISCQGELLCKRIRLNCRVGMMAVAKVEVESAASSGSMPAATKSAWPNQI